MKKIIIFYLLLIFNACLYGSNEQIFEILPIKRNLENIKIVRVIDGNNIGLYGIVNFENEPITELNNIIISVQENYIYLVNIEYKEGLMDIKGNWIGKIGEYNYKEKYSNMYVEDKKNERSLFIVYTKKGLEYLYGYINLEGELQIPIIYEEAENFSQGLAAVKKDGKWGYINEKGEEKIPFRYDEAFDFDKNAALVREGSKYFYIDKNGDKKFFKNMIRYIEEGTSNIFYRIGSAFEGKLKLKQKTEK